jgi:KaiC/GvpD/RAD55 family RecA-like ATPase
MKMIYVIRGVNDGVNFVYVNTREEAERICSQLPDVFKYEPLCSP